MVSLLQSQTRTGSPTDRGDEGIQGFPLSDYCCISLLPPLAYVNKAKTPVGSEADHMATINIHMKRMTRQMEEGNTYILSGKYSNLREMCRKSTNSL